MKREILVNKLVEKMNIHQDIGSFVAFSVGCMENATEIRDLLVFEETPQLTELEIFQLELFVSDIFDVRNIRGDVQDNVLVTDKGLLDSLFTPVKHYIGHTSYNVSVLVIDIMVDAALKNKGYWRLSP